MEASAFGSSDYLRFIIFTNSFIVYKVLVYMIVRNVDFFSYKLNLAPNSVPALRVR